MIFKFKAGQLVRHVRSRGVYTILFDPSVARTKNLEGEWVRAYMYLTTSGVFCREQEEMEEEGRFEFLRNT